MNRARNPRSPMHSSTSTLARLALAAVCALAITGCTSGPEVGPVTTPTPSGTCPKVDSNSDADATQNARIVTPAMLCEVDGSTWTDSVFIHVLNTPKWDVKTPECDEARKTAYYGGWDLAAPVMETLDLMEASSEGENMIGSVGISVIEGPDAAAAIAALDTEGPACSLETSRQVALEHEAWKGVRGPYSQEDDSDMSSWWIATDDRWALVQASASNNVDDAEAAEFEAAISTLLDAQEALLIR